jgi:hypothetical protein
MCKQHWYKVPQHIRLAILRLYKESGMRSPAYWVARGLAIREVAHQEGFGPSESERERLLASWRERREGLRHRLGPRYAGEIAPFVWRLKRLMDEAAAGCPIETCELVIATTGGVSSTQNDRRIAAALDLFEAPPQP